MLNLLNQKLSILQSKMAIAHIIFCSLLKKIYLLIFLLCWLFVTMCGLSLVVAHQLHVVVVSLVVEQMLEFMGSVVVVRGLSCPKACGIFLDQGLNLGPLHWQVDS